MSGKSLQLQIRVTDTLELSLEQTLRVWNVERGWRGVEAGRGLFLTALKEHASPEMWVELDCLTEELQVLRQKIQEHDRQPHDQKYRLAYLAASRRAYKKGWGETDHWFQRDKLPKRFQPKELPIFLEKFHFWLRKWNVDDDWLTKWFATTLDIWCTLSGERGKPLNPAMWLNRIFESPALQIPEPPVLPRYDPHFDNWDSYLEMVMQILEPYRQEAEAQFRAAGLKRSDRNWTLEHFEWLVRYQIRKESFASIRATARKSDGKRYSQNAVREAVRDTATLVDLTLRPAQR